MRKPRKLESDWLWLGGAASVLLAACQPAATESERLSAAIDRQEIVELLNRHQIFIDAGDPEAWAGLYADDGAYESPFGRASGRRELIEMSRSLQESGFTKGKRHLIGPIMVELSGSTATALSYYWVAETDEFPPVIVSTGRYCDELRMVDGHWRIARRVQSIDPNWLLRDTAVPGGVDPAELQRHAARACPAVPASWSAPPR